MKNGIFRYRTESYLPLSVLFSGLLLLTCLWGNDNAAMADEKVAHQLTSSPCYHLGWQYLPSEMVTFFTEGCGAYSLTDKTNTRYQDLIPMGSRSEGLERLASLLTPTQQGTTKHE